MSLPHRRAGKRAGPPAPRAPAARAPAPAVAGVTITHPDRVVYEDVSVTKLMVAGYYAQVAPRLLPHLADRPVSIVRCPGGIERPCFYQKHAGRTAIPGVRSAMIEDGGGRHPYLVAETVQALAGLAQMNVLELHVWGARLASIERPDTLVLDLDPDPALPWARVVAAAQLTRTLLHDLDLDPLVKTTGGHGLHIVLPLARRHGWDEVKAFARGVAERLAGTRPDEFTATMGKEHRHGRIFVDYLRNARGATAVAPYSLRARPGATVATPLSWDELSAREPPSQLTMATIPARIARNADPWADYERRRQRLTAAIQRALAAPRPRRGS
jgi:bifunctional non-homologous end joining protein LigD